jgi:hypothetical protein
MAHFARVIDGTVVMVHVLANQVIADAGGVEQEELGQAFLAELHGYEPAELVQASYNANFRGHYPGPGWSYNNDLDAFIPPKPTEGEWVLDEVTFNWVEVEDEAV